jgi:hypothetical protein
MSATNVSVWSFKLSAVTKPFAVVWRARAYFILAFLFWIVANTLPIPYVSIPAQNLEWWQSLLSKAFGSLDKISYALFLAGLVYAVLSDAFEYTWNASLQQEVRSGFASTGAILETSLSRFVTGLVGMSF